MTVQINITDKTGLHLTEIESLNDNPLQMIAKKIENGDLEVVNYESTFNALEGTCKTTINLRSKVPHINHQRYKYLAMELAQRMETRAPEKTGKLDCAHCHHHNYDWNVDDGYGGDEYEICEKGHELHPDECKDFEEL